METNKGVIFHSFVKSSIGIFLLFFYHLQVVAQSHFTLRQLVDTLAAPSMLGRGYAGNGLAKAAQFIENEYFKVGLKPINHRFRQCFYQPVNIFDGAMTLQIGEKKLVPGVDFLVHPSAAPLHTKGYLRAVDSMHWQDARHPFVVEKVKKLTWSVAGQQQNYTLVQVVVDLPASALIPYEVAIDAKWNQQFSACNLVGFVKGTDQPDSFLVLTAHYDHLGMMGNNTIFQGANDNASGTALMLDLAEAIAAKPLRYTVVFIAFAGEEAGLLGSQYFVQHPLLPLNNIRMLVNLDLLGTGDDGIMVVNATVFPKEFKLLDSLNQQYHWVNRISQRGKAANSDHYWFSERGIPAFFIYTLGGISAYHDVLDLPTTLPLTATQSTGKLINQFFRRLSGDELPSFEKEK